MPSVTNNGIHKSMNSFELERISSWQIDKQNALLKDILKYKGYGIVKEIF